jgi:DDE superfamily endonuclease
VRERLALRMASAIAPLAWIIDEAGLPKAGRYSVGVARQYSGTLGKAAGCQIGVSLSAASAAASCPLTWRLFLPAAWDCEAPRRAKAHLPEAERHREKWRLVLEMLDELRDWGFSPPALVADAGYGEISAFRAALEERELSYVVEVKAAESAYAEDVLPERPAWRGSGRPPASRYRPPPTPRRCRSPGCSASGPRERPSRSSTGWPTGPRRRRCRTSCAWPSRAGASSKITASSRTRWASVNSRGDRFAAGSTTSRSCLARTAF